MVGDYGAQLMKLHFVGKGERRGLGRLLNMSNHVALVCSDIGVSTAFYTDVLGLQ